MVERPLRVYPNGECAELRRVLGPDLLPVRSFFDEFRPLPGMYGRSDAIYGIHGEGHSTRANINCQLLIGILDRLHGIEIDRRVVGHFTQTHDLMRIDDDHDPDHGQRAAIFVLSVNGLVPASLAPSVARLNFWHVPPDWEAPMSYLLAAAKEGDSLDRFREQDQTKGAFNPSYLRFEESRGLLMKPAKLLCQLSAELERVYGLSPYDAAMEASVMMGIVRNQ